MLNKLFPLILGLALLLCGLVVGHAENPNLQTDVAGAPFSIVATAGSTGTQSRAFTAGLAKSVTQSLQFAGAGTSPNFKLELLVSVDGVTFVKPETGGDLGTYTDTNTHVVAINVPLSPGGHKVFVTELGGANTITVTGQEASQ